jgi:predicted N-acetyltransferase YhbS
MPDMAQLPPGDFYRPEVVDGRTRVFVGYVDGEPAATSAAHSAAGLTVVENVAVLPSARGRGAGAALTWAATTAWPGQPAALVASDAGQPVYERLGYLRLVRWTCWVKP